MSKFVLASQKEIKTSVENHLSQSLLDGLSEWWKSVLDFAMNKEVFYVRGVLAEYLREPSSQPPLASNHAELFVRCVGGTLSQTLEHTDDILVALLLVVHGGVHLAVNHDLEVQELVYLFALMESLCQEMRSLSEDAFFTLHEVVSDNPKTMQKIQEWVEAWCVEPQDAAGWLDLYRPDPALEEGVRQEREKWLNGPMPDRALWNATLSHYRISEYELYRLRLLASFDASKFCQALRSVPTVSLMSTALQFWMRWESSQLMLVTLMLQHDPIAYDSKGNWTGNVAAILATRQIWRIGVSKYRDSSAEDRIHITTSCTSTLLDILLSREDGVLLAMLLGNKCIAYQKRGHREKEVSDILLEIIVQKITTLCTPWIDAALQQIKRRIDAPQGHNRSGISTLFVMGTLLVQEEDSPKLRFAWWSAYKKAWMEHPEAFADVMISIDDPPDEWPLSQLGWLLSSCDSPLSEWREVWERLENQRRRQVWSRQLRREFVVPSAYWIHIGGFASNAVDVEARFESLQLWDACAHEAFVFRHSLPHYFHASGQGLFNMHCVIGWLIHGKPILAHIAPFIEQMVPEPYQIRDLALMLMENNLQVEELMPHLLPYITRIAPYLALSLQHDNDHKFRANATSHRNIKLARALIETQTATDLKRVVDLVKQRGILSRSDLRNEHLPEEYLFQLHEEGRLVQLTPGTYMDVDADMSELLELAVVAKRVPRAVFFGLTALVFHRLTTQVAHSVEFAIERDSWTPKFEWPTTDVFHLSGKSFSTGIEEHIIEDDVPIRVYSVAKTVADLFKFRSRFGLDVAIEALNEGWREKRFSMEELEVCAKACRVRNVMRPYMEVLS